MISIETDLNVIPPPLTNLLLVVSTFLWGQGGSKVNEEENFQFPSKIITVDKNLKGLPRLFEWMDQLVDV